jgi:hypothetical protein
LNKSNKYSRAAQAPLAPQAVLPARAARLLGALAGPGPFEAAPPEARGPFSTSLREGLVLPTDQAIRGGLVPAREVSALAKGARGWLRLALEEPFAPPRSAPLLAVRGALEGEDALLGAWRARRGRGAPIRAAVTRERVHLSLPLGPASEEPRASAAQRRAAEVLGMDAALEAQEWRSVEVGEWLLVYPEVTEPERWDQTVLIATDGAGLKLSFLKLRERIGPARGEGASRAWFRTKEG